MKKIDIVKDKLLAFLKENPGPWYMDEAGVEDDEHSAVYSLVARAEGEFAYVHPVKPISPSLPRRYEYRPDLPARSPGDGARIYAVRVDRGLLTQKIEKFLREPQNQGVTFTPEELYPIFNPMLTHPGKVAPGPESFRRAIRETLADGGFTRQIKPVVHKGGRLIGIKYEKRTTAPAAVAAPDDGQTTAPDEQEVYLDKATDWSWLDRELEPEAPVVAQEHVVLSLATPAMQGYTPRANPRDLPRSPSLVVTPRSTPQAAESWSLDYIDDEDGGYAVLTDIVNVLWGAKCIRPGRSRVDHGSDSWLVVRPLIGGRVLVRRSLDSSLWVAKHIDLKGQA